MASQSLSFTLCLADGAADLADACRVRAESYGHHLPEMKARLAEPDALDLAEGTAVLLCRDKASGAAIGTARIQTSAFGPLQLERSLILPGRYAGQPRAEITRLAVAAGADPLVKLCLMKASYLYCLANQQRFMVIGARNEALIRNYRRLGFQDVLGADDRVPLSHAGNLPHRILAFDVLTAERTWHEGRHALYAFMIDTYHEDLRLFGRTPVAVGRPAVAAERLVAVA